MIGMQGKDAIQGFHQHRIDFIGLAWSGKHHAHKVSGVGQAIVRIHKGLSNRVLIGHSD